MAAILFKTEWVNMAELSQQDGTAYKSVFCDATYYD